MFKMNVHKWINIMYLICGILNCSASQMFRSVRNTTAIGSPYKTRTVRSRLECAATCTADASSDLCGYNDGTGQCELFTWKDVVFKNPNNAGQDASTVMIRRKLEVVRVRSWGGQAVAESICQKFGGDITTYAELAYAFNNYGLHVGTCCRVSAGQLYYALQFQVAGIGFQGINECFWKYDGDVFCTIPGPTV